MIGRTTPEQRAPLFEDTEALITTGFLSTVVQVGSTYLSLRTLHPWDLTLLRARSEGRADVSWRIRAVAAALWLVNDVLLLGDMNLGHQCIKLVGNFDRGVLDHLFGIVLGLFARQLATQESCGLFVYENRSRELWKMMGPSPWLASGTPHSAAMGSNWTQRWWVAFNQVEDERVRLESQWEGFKLAASAQAPQAVRKIDERDRDLRDKEMARRQALLDQYFWHKAGVIDRDGYLRGAARWALGSRPGSVRKTDDDLENEYRRWVAGDMDDHDRVVENHKRAAMDNDRRALEAERRAMEAEIAQEAEESSDLVIRSVAQAEALDAKTRRGTTWVPDVKVAAGRAYWERRAAGGRGL